MNKYKQEGINFLSEKDDWKKNWKKMQQSHLILCMSKKRKIHPAFVSKNNPNRKKQVIFLMFPNRAKLKAKSK